MATSYKDIKNERQWKAMTGLSQQEFTSLNTAFGLAYEQIHGIALQQGAANLGKAVVLSSYADCLFFTLFELNLQSEPEDKCSWEKQIQKQTRTCRIVIKFANRKNRNMCFSSKTNLIYP